MLFFRHLIIIALVYSCKHVHSNDLVPWKEDSADSCSSHCTYRPTWDSLDSRPLPSWYDNAKFGIFIHWGVFSVPAMGEWFWYNWKGHEYPGVVQYMKDHYKPNFTYQEFAKDFTAESFKPDEWAKLFKLSGAKYVVLTSKHHEGYTLWPSKSSFSWNSVDIGPHVDLIDKLAKAVRAENLIFGLYHSLYEWFNPLYLYDKNNNFTTKHFVFTKTMVELFELVQTYKPEIIWSDGEWEANSDYWSAKEFLAWLYNISPVKDTVVVNDRWGSESLCKHGGFLTCEDRYNPEKLQRRKWENALTIDKYSWGFRKSANISNYYTYKELIKSLVQTVSYGGNLLLNVGPTHYGTIPPIFQERLLQIGTWLNLNGEAIYNTQPWNICQNDTLSKNVWYTRGTGPAKDTLYVIFFNWPDSDNILLGCLNLPSTATITIFGYEGSLKV